MTGIKYQAATRRGDVIHYSWVLDCCSQKHLLPLQPKLVSSYRHWFSAEIDNALVIVCFLERYFLFIADSSKHKLQEEADAFSDYYYCDLDVRDLKQLFTNMNRSEEPTRIDHYKKKYCPMEKWSLFQDCRVYFHPIHILNPDCKVLLELSIRRMKFDVSMYGGEVSDDISSATHVVVFSITKSVVAFNTISESVPAEKRHFLCTKQLHIVGHLWLEDSLEKGRRLQEGSYNLNPHLSDVEDQSGENTEAEIASYIEKKQLFTAIPDTGEKQKKGRPTPANTRRERTGIQPAQRTWARHGSRPAKINQHEPENRVFPEEVHGKREAEFEYGSIDNHGNTMEEQMVCGGDKSFGSDNSSGIELVKLKDSENDERGRPTLANKKRGVGFQPAQRPRARHGRRLAKIDQKELENSLSESRNEKDEAELKSGSVDYHGIATDEKKNNDENERLGNAGISHGVETAKQKDVQNDESGEEFNNMQDVTGGKNEAILRNENSGVANYTLAATKHENKGKRGKLELMVDPVQAMLLDMIPALSQSKVEAGKSAVEDEKLSIDPETKPVKKKRVSYKDVANELLKDW
ncbi:hypothetical protein ACLOJK_030797 [Asimina triloba]